VVSESERKTPREVAEEMVGPVLHDGERLRVSLGDEFDYVPLEPQDNLYEARGMREEAVDIIERLVTRDRAPLESDLERHKQAILALTDELKRAIAVKETAEAMATWGPTDNDGLTVRPCQAPEWLNEQCEDAAVAFDPECGTEFCKPHARQWAAHVERELGDLPATMRRIGDHPAEPEGFPDDHEADPYHAVAVDDRDGPWRGILDVAAREWCTRTRYTSEAE
jgi:hypothetical protein